MEFRWNEWNIEHIARHRVDPVTAEWVVEDAKAPFPRRIDEDKLLVWGRGPAGELIQVVFVLDEDGTIYVLHARPLTAKERTRYRTKR